MNSSPSHSLFIQRAIACAISARQKGNHPFGALLVFRKKVILTAENTVVTDGDPTQHAELRLVSHASRRFSRSVLERSTLYASTEPCAMCSGAIYWAGLRNVVFGCSAKTLEEITGGNLLIHCSEIFRHGNEKTRIIGPIELERSKQVHIGFWK